MRFAMISLAVFAVATGCSGSEDVPFTGPDQDTELPGVPAPKDEVSPKTLAERAPLKGLGTVFLNGFHYAADDPLMQMEANHYCRKVAPAMHECVVLDVYGRLSGVEHVIGREAFARMSAKERALWHPHNYEVKSGMLVAPGMSEEEELVLMKELVTTYGKIWQVYPEVHAAAPTGEAMLMKGFTDDGQLDASLLQERDERFGISSAAKKEARAGIPDPGFDPVVLEVGPPPRKTGPMGPIEPSFTIGR